MKTLKILAFLLLVFNTVSTSAQWAYKDFKPLKKLAGNWYFPNTIYESGEKTKDTIEAFWVNENWQQINDSTLNGISGLMPKDDTTHTEALQLIFSNNEIVLIITSDNQNGGLPIHYKLKSIDKGSYNFENESTDHQIQSVKYQIKPHKRWMVEVRSLTDKGLSTRRYWLSK
jgi:hypothetical protein